MKYTISDYNTKRFIISELVIAIISYPLLIITSVHYLNATALVTTSVLLIPLTFILSLIISKKVIAISLDDRKIQLGNQEVLLGEIIGYYINRESPIMVMIEIKDKSLNKYALTSLNFGKSGKDFTNFIRDFEEVVLTENQNVKQFTFFDFHPKQYFFTKIFLIVFAGIILIIDIIYTYQVIYGGYKLTWKIIFLNSIYLGLYGFYKRNKNSRQRTRKGLSGTYQ